MKVVQVDGVSIFVKDELLVHHPYYEGKMFPDCKSKDFAKFRESIVNIFKWFNKYIPDIDIDKSTIMTVSGLFENQEMDLYYMTLKSKPEDVSYEGMWYGYKIGDLFINCSGVNLHNYAKLSCTLLFVLKTDKYEESFIKIITDCIKNEKSYDIDNNTYYGFVKNCSLKENSSPKNSESYKRDPASVGKAFDYEYSVYRHIYQDARRICYGSEIDTILSRRTTDELVDTASFIENIDKNKKAGIDGIKGFDEDFLNEINDYIENQFLITSSKSYPHIITFEGLAGCGRSTLAKRIADSCKSNVFREHDFIDHVTEEECSQPHYIEIDTRGLIPAYGDCVIFINHAEGYLNTDLLNSFIAATKNCRERCLIILSASTGSIDELLSSSDTLRGLISKRFAFKNYTVDNEIEVLNWILSNLYSRYLEADNYSIKEEIRESLKDLILTAAHCPKESEEQDEYNVSVGGELANGYFAARLAEVLTSENGREDPGSMYIKAPVVKKVCEKLKAEFEKTGMVLSSQVVAEKDRSDKKLTFDDVVGNKTAIKELEKCLEWMKSDETGMRAVCLTGEPGCGKTFMARVVASMANAKFISKAGNDYIQNYSGQGAVALGELFDRVDGYKRCVLFIDEIDAIGKAREAGNIDTLGNQALNKLLTRLDGFTTRKNKLILITATNCYDMLDPALKRRLGTRVDIRLPNREDRIAMLEHCLKTLPNGYTAEGFDDNAKEELSDEMEGMSFDRIQKVVTNVVDDLRGEENKTITKTLIYDRIYDELLGRKIENDTRDKETLERIAVHELGHTIAAVRSGRKVGYCTIVARESGVGGYTKMITTRQEGAPLTLDELKKEVRISLGGRAAEDIYYKGNVSNGCSGDISHVTALLRNAYAQGGLGDTLTVRSVDSPEVCAKAEEECQKLYKETKEMIISKMEHELYPETLKKLVELGSIDDESYRWIYDNKK